MIHTTQNLLHNKRQGTLIRDAAAMHLMYYLDEQGNRVYTLKVSIIYVKGGTEKHNPFHIAPVVLKKNQREQYSPLGPIDWWCKWVAAKSLVVPLYPKGPTNTRQNPEINLSL